MTDDNSLNALVTFAPYPGSLSTPAARSVDLKAAFTAEAQIGPHRIWRITAKSRSRLNGRFQVSASSHR